MAEQQYQLKTVDRAFEVLRIVMDAPAPLSLSEIAVRADSSTSNVFRFLKTLEASGHVSRDKAKRYVAPRGGGGEIGLVRGIELLDLIAAEGAAGAADLAAAMGVDVPQVERALAKLQGRTVVEYDQSEDAWRLSTGMMRFFRPLLNDRLLARFVRPWMVELSEAHGETVSWFVPHEWEQVVVEVIPSPHPLRYVLETGARQPSYLGAGGKAQLAAQDEAAVAAYLDRLEPVHQTAFRLDKAALVAELAEIRARGFAISNSERVEGAASVAVPVRAPNGQLMGVVSVMMPAFRKTSDELHAIGAKMTARAATIFETEMT